MIQYLKSLVEVKIAFNIEISTESQAFHQSIYWSFIVKLLVRGFKGTISLVKSIRFLFAQKRKKYYYQLILFALICVLLFTPVQLSHAQQGSDINSIPTLDVSPTPTSRPTPNLSGSTESSVTIAKLPTVIDINPKELFVNIPQSFLPETRRDGKAQGEPVQVVVTGRNFPKDANSIAIKIGHPSNPAQAIATEVTEDQQAFFATFSGDQLNLLTRGRNPINVEVDHRIIPIDGRETEGTLGINVIRDISGLSTLIVGVLALIFTTVPLLIIYKLVEQDRQASLPQPQLGNRRRKLGTLGWIILDRETNTFSLARLQFVWWLTIIVFGYLFMMIGRGLIQDVWEFIPLSGFGYTFLISLATLVTAQVTSQLRGSKGSGEVHPAWSDLVVHGGVVALERIQQVVWNSIIGVAFVWILIDSYTTATSLPEIPSELLTLMGISAAGYIGGKAIRKPGPIISQVLPDVGPESSTSIQGITIAGDHFSQGGLIKNEESNSYIKDSGVIVQVAYLKDKDSCEEEEGKRFEFRKDDIITLEPDSDQEFCKKLQVKFGRCSEFDKKLPDFSQRFKNEEVKVTVINADSQRAAWTDSMLAPDRSTTSTQSASN